MKRAITCVAVLSLCAGALGQVTYQYDDGGGLRGGPPTAGTFVWGNIFEVQDGASEITSVLVALGTIAPGSTVTALVYEDPNDDGNPDDAVLLTSVEFTPAIINSNSFNEVEVSPTRVTGRFFVACAVTVDGTGATYAARTDPNGRAFGDRTFLYWGPNLDPATLSGWSTRVQYVNTAVALVRAVGRVPVDPPSCPADIGVAGGLPGSDGVLDNNDFIAFITHFFNQSPQADVGIAGGLAGSDGAWDNNDFIAFINLFFAGC